MLRIVSLIASATEIVHALGLGECQVGRSHECDYPPEVLRLPVCTRPKFDVSGSSRDIDRLVKETLAAELSVYDVFDDVLERLRPTVIVTQSHCQVCAVTLKDVERALEEQVAWRPKVVSLFPDSLADVWADIRHVADACEMPERGERLVGELRARLEGLSRKAPARRPRVACIEWIEPLIEAGNWMPELVQIAGGEYVGMAGEPELVLVSPCGFDLERTTQEMHWIADRPELKRARVYLADGNQYFSRPGPRLVDSAEMLQAMILGEAETGWAGCRLMR